MSARTSRHRTYAGDCGPVTVFITPSTSYSDSVECRDKPPVRVRVTARGRRPWEPESPLCLSPLYDANSRDGRRHAAEDAAAFYEHHRCGQGAPLDGARRCRARGR